jgi:hypothetical protein
MSKMIKLWNEAVVHGRLRYPHEGVLHLDDQEAKRLIEDGSAEDVTGDFSEAQMNAQPVESVTVQAGQPAAPASFDPAAEEGRIIAERQAAATAAPDPLDHDGDGRKGGSKRKGT